MKHGAVRFAILEADSKRIELGWKPRDAVYRLRNQRTLNGNWLVVHGRVACEAGAWEFADQALQEHEAAEIGEFLSQRPWPTGQSTRSVESLITFIARDTLDGYIGLDIRFRGEAAPKWLEDPWGPGIVVSVDAREHHIQDFARAWRSLLGFIT